MIPNSSRLQIIRCHTHSNLSTANTDTSHKILLFALMFCDIGGNSIYKMNWDKIHGNCTTYHTFHFHPYSRRLKLNINQEFSVSGRFELIKFGNNVKHWVCVYIFYGLNIWLNVKRDYYPICLSKNYQTLNIYLAIYFAWRLKLC